MRYTAPHCGGGLIQDVSAVQLGPEYWSQARNILFENGAAKRVDGYTLFNAATGTPIHAVAVQAGANYYWVYANDAGNILAYDGAIEDNINRGGGTDEYSTIPTKWTSDVLGGILVLNNGVDTPQYWASASLATDLADLTAWTADLPANTTCGALRSYRDFLIALDLTENGAEFPYRMRWSNPAISGTVPSSWDEGDPATLAGFYDFSQTNGYVIDGGAVNDAFIVHKSDSIWRAQWVPSPEVFAFSLISNETGVLSTNCLQTYKGVQFGIMQGDVVACDGLSIRSIIDKRNRDYLFRNIDSENFDRTFLGLDTANSRLMVCYPQQGSTFPDSALIYDIEQDTWGQRDIPNLHHIANGIVDPGESQLVDDYNDLVDSNDGFVDALSFNPSEVSTLWASNDGNLYKGDEGDTANGVAMTGTVTRQDITLDGSLHTRNMITQVVPQITGSEGLSV
ncbi:MAG: hypothetical protein AAF387_21140, partial [Pseudomonadota bacterium]